MSYSADNLRQRRSTSAGTANLVWDGLNVLLEKDQAGATQAHYTDFPAAWGGLSSQRRGATSSFFGFDAQKNTRFLATAAGAVSDSYLCKAFGEELSVSGSTSNPFRFGGGVGYYRDLPARLYVRARHLNVSSGRWLSRDPIPAAGGSSYVYAINRPVSLIDPSGLSVNPPWRSGGVLSLVLTAYIGTACVETFYKPLRGGWGDGPRLENPWGGTFRTMNAAKIGYWNRFYNNECCIDTGIGYGIDCPDWPRIRLGHATGSSLHVGICGWSLPSGQLAYIVRMWGAEAPPYSLGAFAITYDMFVSVVPNFGYNVWGSHGGYPNYELWAYPHGAAPLWLHRWRSVFPWNDALFWTKFPVFSQAPPSHIPGLSQDGYATCVRFLYQYGRESPFDCRYCGLTPRQPGAPPPPTTWHYQWS